MRHAFKFPRHLQQAVRTHIERAVLSVNPNRYRQEPPYTAALVSRLEGEAYRQDDGFVVFESTVVDDRGPNAAERWSGVDFAITAKISDGRITIRKAILVQAKLGKLTELEPREHERLLDQIKQMKRLTRSPKVMEIDGDNNSRVPRIISGNRVLDGEPYRPMSLANYFVARVLTTLDGDTRPEFVDSVQDSSLTRLRVLAGVFA